MDESSQSLDRFLRLLADRQRRQVVAALDDAGQALPVTAVVETVVSCERGSVPGSGPDPGSGEAPADAYRNVRVRLHHQHLPKLAGADVVEHDPDAGIVATGEQFSAASAVLDVVAAADDANG